MKRLSKKSPETKLNLNDVPAYIEPRDGGYYVIGTPISLESVIHQFKEGLSAETIQRECFPLLTLEQVYGVCTYYLRHKEKVEEYLQEAERDLERLPGQLEEQYPGLLHRQDHLRQLRGY